MGKEPDQKPILGWQKAEEKPTAAHTTSKVEAKSSEKCL